MHARIWTTRRKWLGNLIPILCVLPFVILSGIFVWVQRGVGVVPIVIGLAGIVVGWLAVNQFGLIGNAELRTALQRKLLAKASKNATSGIFVGFARPTYMGLLDAHEDLGFLFIEEDRVEYCGEQYHVLMHRWEIKNIRFRPNVHTYLGLGRWISIEGTVLNKPVRLLIEPRQSATLFGNRQRSRELRAKLEAWRAEKPARPKA